MIGLKENIKKWFKERVTLHETVDPELRRILLSEPQHPRLEGFFDNLHAQFILADKMCQKRGLNLQQKTMQDTVYDLTNVFITGFETEAKRRYESDLEKAAREAQAAQIKEFDDVLAGNATGEFAEAGVITNEKIDKQREAYLEAQDRQKAQQQINH